MADLRYPIGSFEAGPPPDPQTREQLLCQLADMAANLRAAVANLSSAQLDAPYRPGGWTVRQVVHHLADAAMNWYVRTKLAVTEDDPPVKTYEEARWAELHDARTGPIETSLVLLEGLHRRWVDLFRSFSEPQWKRSMIHPERGSLALDTVLAMLAWHGRHHTAQIMELRKRSGW